MHSIDDSHDCQNFQMLQIETLSADISVTNFGTASICSRINADEVPMER